MLYYIQQIQQLEFETTHHGSWKHKIDLFVCQENENFMLILCMALECRLLTDLCDFLYIQMNMKSHMVSMIFLNGK